MSCVCLRPQESFDPRHGGSCVKCGRHINGKHIVGDGEVRDWFDTVGRYQPVHLPRQHQASPIHDYDAFRTHCEIRERWGRAHFAHAYLDRDNPAEAMEECADGAIYAMLENYSMFRTEFDPDVAASLLDATYHLALAHAAFRRAQGQKRGTPFAVSEGGDE